MHNFLIDIINNKKDSIKNIDIDKFSDTARLKEKRSIVDVFNLKKNSPVIIAEIKKASPSLGTIRDNFNFNGIFNEYNRNTNVDAVSILTEEKYFKGNLEFIEAADKISVKPLLRKDFIIDAKQIYETSYSGADMMLLIAGILTENEYSEFYRLGKSLGLEIITEVHTPSELKMVEKYSPEIIGINNRDLKTFKVDIRVSEELYSQKNTDAIYISESGIKSNEDIKKLFGIGFKGFLIGELLMKNQDIKNTLINLFKN